MTNQSQFIQRPPIVREFGKVCPQCERILLHNEIDQNACADCQQTIASPLQHIGIGVAYMAPETSVVPTSPVIETKIEGESHD